MSENGASTLATIAYDEFHRRSRIDRDTTGAVTTFTPDPISRLLSIFQDLDGGGTANDLAIGFAYNPASQIEARSQTNDAYDYQIPAESRTYTSNGRNQYTQIAGTGAATLTWDANGNLTSDGSTTFVYDTENRLTGASGAKSATLTYDPLGRLYQTVTSAGTSRFVYDGDRLIAEYSTGGAVQRRYVHGAGVDEPLVWYEGATVSAASRRYLHADHQGSIVALTGATGGTIQKNVYDAYGVTTAANTGRFQYTGQAAIPQIGLYYYKARFYNPALGRFMQTDPIGYDDDNNLYAYVYNDPLNRADPSGLAGIESCTGSRVGAGCDFVKGSTQQARLLTSNARQASSVTGLPAFEPAGPFGPAPPIFGDVAASAGLAATWGGLAADAGRAVGSGGLAATTPIDPRLAPGRLQDVGLRFARQQQATRLLVLRVGGNTLVVGSVVFDAISARQSFRSGDTFDATHRAFNAAVGSGSLFLAGSGNPLALVGLAYSVGDAAASVVHPDGLWAPFR